MWKENSKIRKEEPRKNNMKNKKKDKTTRIRIRRGQRRMKRNMIRSNNNNIPFKLKHEYMCSGMFINKIII